MKAVFGPYFFSKLILISWFVMALSSDFISSSNPLAIKGDQGWTYIGPYQNFDLEKESGVEKIIWPLVPFSEKDLDLSVKRLSRPGTKSMTSSHIHILGTDRVGRDILAGLIHGARFSLIIVTVSVSGIGFLGLIIGIAMGYFGDKKVRIPSIFLFPFILIVLLILFWISEFGFSESWLPISILTGAAMVLAALIKRFRKKLQQKRIRIPFDFILSRFLEIFETIPKLFLLLVLISVLDPGNNRLLIALIITGWLSLAKMIRGKTLSISNSPLIESLKSMGASEFRILFRHIVTFILPDLLAYLAYGAGNIILIESALTFLGLGVSPDVVSWGSLLSLAPYKPEYWWLAVAPGLLIFGVVYSLIRIGDLLYERLTPEQTNWRYYDLV
jgi:peptide/nickel transport system permease protein